jgi:uncharacterized membrane protein (UPF0182 family)
MGFYIFSLPFWKLIDVWLGGLFLFGLLSILILYLQGNNHLSEGKFPGFNVSQLRHLCRLGSLMMVAIALRHWINRYQLLYSNHEVVYGANYTDVHLRIPFETFLVLISLGIATWLMYQAY